MRPSWHWNSAIVLDECMLCITRVARLVNCNALTRVIDAKLRPALLPAAFFSSQSGRQDTGPSESIM